MNRIASPLFALALAGCSSTLAPPPLLTVPQIQEQQRLTAAIPPGEVHDFYVSGLLMAQKNCGGYFDLAVMSALQTAQTSGQAQILSGLALGVMGLTGVGGPAVAGAGLAGNFLTNLLSNQQSNSLAGADPAGMYTLTGTAQKLLIEAMPSPVTGADAYAAVYAVERACTPAGIQALKEQAIAAAPSHLSVIGSTGAAAARSLAPTSARSLPAVVVR